MNLRWKFLIGCVFLIALNLSLRADEKFSALKVGKQTYTNVTVTSVSPTDIFFTHSGGMSNAKLKDLEPALQKHFNYDAAKADATEKKRAEANAQFHKQIITAPIAHPADEMRDFSSEKVHAAITYGDVSAEYRDTTVTKTGDFSPLSSIHTVDGRDLDFHGKVVLIDFFATWCGPCKEEMPLIEKNLWQQFKDKGLIVVAVGREHSEQEVKAFQQQTGYSFLFAADPNQENYRKFATKYIPRCVLIGKDGQIKCQTVGFSQQDIQMLVSGTFNELQRM